MQMLHRSSCQSSAKAASRKHLQRSCWSDPSRYLRGCFLPTKPIGSAEGAGAMRRLLAIGVAAGSLLVATGPLPTSAANVILITPEEARLPAPKIAVAMSARGVTRGPQIEVVQE